MTDEELELNYNEIRKLMLKRHGRGKGVQLTLDGEIAIPFGRELDAVTKDMAIQRHLLVDETKLVRTGGVDYSAQDMEMIK